MERNWQNYRKLLLGSDGFNGNDVPAVSPFVPYLVAPNCNLRFQSFAINKMGKVYMYRVKKRGRKKEWTVRRGERTAKRRWRGRLIGDSYSRATRVRWRRRGRSRQRVRGKNFSNKRKEKRLTIEKNRGRVQLSSVPVPTFSPVFKGKFEKNE